jgi:hypothetical protein
MDNSGKLMQFEELDSVTREWMLKEFQKEQDGINSYQSKEMTPFGISQFKVLMEKAIISGNEVMLGKDLSIPSFWQPYGYSHRNGKSFRRKINFIESASRFALTEFNTWYVRGLAKRLMEEGEEYCEVYRAGLAAQPRPECRDHDGKQFKLIDVYNGHRAQYWPKPNNTAFSIPIGPNCHHTIRRIRR